MVPALARIATSLVTSTALTSVTRGPLRLGSPNTITVGTPRRNVPDAKVVQPRQPAAPTKVKVGGPIPIKLGRNWFNDLFAISTAAAAAHRIGQTMPCTIHEVTVSVVGGPESTIERIWQLCVATAFGKYREGPNFNLGMADVTYQAVWDLSAKAVAFRIISDSNGWGVAVDALLKPFLASPRQRNSSGLGYLLTGPSQETCGGLYPAVFSDVARKTRPKVVGGMPVGRNRAAPDADKVQVDFQKLGDLPDDGKMITSGYKYDPEFQPPSPMREENITDIVSLVSAAIKTPGYLPYRVPEIKRGDFPQSSPIIYTDHREPPNLLTRILQFGRQNLGGIKETISRKSIDGYKTRNQDTRDPVLEDPLDNNRKKFGDSVPGLDGELRNN